MEFSVRSRGQTALFLEKGRKSGEGLRTQAVWRWQKQEEWCGLAWTGPACTSGTGNTGREQHDIPPGTGG